MQRNISTFRLVLLLLLDSPQTCPQTELPDQNSPNAHSQFIISDALILCYLPGLVWLAPKSGTGTARGAQSCNLVLVLSSLNFTVIINELLQCQINAYHQKSIHQEMLYSSSCSPLPPLQPITHLRCAKSIALTWQR